MYLEEEMGGRAMMTEERQRWVYLSSRLDHLLTEQQQMAGRLAALESPIQAFEDQPSMVDAMRQNLQRITAEEVELEERLHRALVENEKLAEEVRRLRSRLQMMQAGYNAIATIQARLDANEQEMEGHRCCTG